ncbi:hypothetical protein [Ralstonia pseudosolanacearum]|uniref:hypothetical protein n=1 Tax=Ralstonia pseudosolanacearum TaxID=1310165 RepID=UPI002175EE8C|nr:hypothetical protein [Ralstonia pseudosolanacearum]UWD89522.1 hypothetical protein NY025_17620 [Ralstonia pseudosolanacearum]
MADVNLVEAVNLALAHALEHDPSVVLLGEDIGVNGGVFRATVGLQARFGAERVIDTPLAETALAGAAVGMAAMELAGRWSRSSSAASSIRSSTTCSITRPGCGIARAGGCRARW